MACDAILWRTPREQAEHAKALAEIVAPTSWDATTQTMGELIETADRSRVTQDRWHGWQ